MQNNPEDVILWACGTWCYRYELYEFKHKSDDYEVIYFGTPSYEEFFDSILKGTKLCE